MARPGLFNRSAGWRPRERRVSGRHGAGLWFVRAAGRAWGRLSGARRVSRVAPAASCFLRLHGIRCTFNSACACCSALRFPAHRSPTIDTGQTQLIFSRASCVDYHIAIPAAPCCGLVHPETVGALRRICSGDHLGSRHCFPVWPDGSTRAVHGCYAVGAAGTGGLGARRRGRWWRALLRILLGSDLGTVC